ncbi:ParB/RepB/Spo0J family partition protein [Rickettsiales bacterium]|nr:ParB/RepB/Spo0J family partition protein [Rickettsiales bacterium]
MSNNNNQKLGRGLSVLLGEERKFNNNRVKMTNIGRGFTVYQMPITKIIAGIYQPRSKFDDNTLEELSESIKEYGIIQPIIVRKASKDQDIYEIISGERRFRAAKLADLKEVPAIIRDLESDQALAIGILENIQREDLSILEEAKAYKQLIEEFHYSQKDISHKVGKSRSHIANLLRLISLPQEVQIMLEDKLITMGHVKVIMNRSDIIEIAKIIIDQSLSVRQAEQLCSNLTEELFPNKEADNIVKEKQKITEYNQKTTNLTNKLRNILGSDIKINNKFNPNKNQGKIIISYNDLDKITEIINKLDDI